MIVIRNTFNAQLCAVARPEDVPIPQTCRYVR